MSLRMAAPWQVLLPTNCCAAVSAPGTPGTHTTIVVAGNARIALGLIAMRTRTGCLKSSL